MMRDLYVPYQLQDNGGRRTGIERRRFSYAEHIPERRSGEDRRKSRDRRCGMERRCGEDRRSGMERRASRRAGIVWKDRRGKSERRAGHDRRAFPVL
jgi:hypothetical protein